MVSSNLWSLKYRPETLDDIAGRKILVDRLKEISKKDNIPHMLFAGPKGFGKMTAAYLMAKTILGESFTTNFKVIYASDPLTKEEREEVKRKSYVSTSKVGSAAGRTFTWPAFVFSRVKPFVELKPFGEKSFKILIIRDFHELDSDQQGFRRLMEKYSKTCRMILVTDEISSVIDPILSRCMTFIFNKIDEDSFTDVIQNVSNRESLVITQNLPKMLYIATDGRIGDSLNILQKAAGKGEKITPDEIYSAINNDLKLQIGILLRHSLQSKVPQMESVLKKIKDSGISLKEIHSGLCDEIFNLPIAETLKAGLVNIISDADFDGLDANDPNIQLDSLMYQLLLLSKKIKEIEA